MDRLIDYCIFVGARHPKVDAIQPPEVLRRFPREDYKDFPLPMDVVFFCQPEGCATVSKRLSLRETNSFVFTLTEKETGTTRYGICCNFFRSGFGQKYVEENNSQTNDDQKRLSQEFNMVLSPGGHTARYHEEPTRGRFSYSPRDINGPRFGSDSYPMENDYSPGDHLNTSYTNFDESLLSSTRAYPRQPSKTVVCRTLSSICIISRYPFFSTFRECLFVLRKLVETRQSSPLTLEKLSQIHNFRAGRTKIYRSNTINLPMDHTKPMPSSTVKNWTYFLLLDNIESVACPGHRELQEIEHWIERLLQIPLPVAGVSRVEVELLPRHVQPPLTFALPEKSRFSLLDFPLHLPLELLGVETCLKVLTCILLEQKVVLQSRDYNALSISVMALTAMLYPLEYMFPVIPLLPTCMRNAEQLLLAPTPYVIGVPSSFFRYKGSSFQVPGDVLVVDLDTNKLCVPLSMDEIPALPEPEGRLLLSQLKQCLACLSLNPQPLKDIGHMATMSRKDSTAGMNMSEVIYGNDIDSVDVAVRAAMVKFFNSPNVLQGFSHHLRTLRLYPRPVVAIEREAFVKSRPNETEFVSKLASTQAVEYFGEWLLNPTNTVFRKVQHGILDPRVVGDKPRWYSHYLEPIYYQVHNPHSVLWQGMADDSDSDPHENGDDDEMIGNCSGSDDTSFSDLEEYLGPEVSERYREVSLLSSPAHEIKEMYDSSYSSYHAPENEEEGNVQNNVGMRAVLSRQTSTVFNKKPHRQEAIIVYDTEADGTGILDRSFTQQDQGVYSYSTDEETEGAIGVDDKRLSISSVASSDISSRHGSVASASGKFISLIDTLKPKLTHKWSLDSHVSLSSFQSSSLDSENGSNRASPTSTKASDEVSNPGPKMYFLERAFEDRPAKNTKDTKVFTSDNKQILDDITKSVLRGDGIGWLNQKKLRRLVAHESLRQYFINQLYTPAEQSKGDVAMLDIHVTRNVYRGLLDSVKAIIQGYEESIEKRGLGGLSSVFQMLEIILTHYCGKRLVDDTTRSVQEDTNAPKPSPLEGSISRLDSGVDDRSDSSLVYRRDSRSSASESLTVGRDTTSSDFTWQTHDASESPPGEKQSPRHSQTSTYSSEGTPGAGTLFRVPSLTHASLSVSSSLTYSEGDLSTTSTLRCLSEQPRHIVCKSSCSAGHRYYNSELIEAKRERAGKGIQGTGRRFIFEGLANQRSSIWDDMEFWEYCFMDAVTSERESLGMAIGTIELLNRYKSFSSKERHVLEEDEDQILGVTLHNMISYMLAMGVDKTQIRRKVRRLLGKAHIGMVQTQELNTVLDHLDKLNGNDIDLRPPQSRLMTKHVFVIHLGDDQSGPVFFLEVCDDCMLLKSTQGGIVERWWYENIVNMSCSPRTKVLCLCIKSGEQTDLQRISTKKCKTLYTCIRDSMRKTAERIKGPSAGIDLGGEFQVEDPETGQEGLLRVSLEGLSIIFVDRKLQIDVKNLKNCSTKHGKLYINEVIPHTQNVLEHEFISPKAKDICYAVVCLFSYLATTRNSDSEKESSTSHTD